MSEFTMPSIDVAIPVYNAPELTRRCINSVITYLGQSIQCIHVQNDASDIKTREMLDSLPYEQLRVHHAPKNQGFGLSVNEAVARSDACHVLVLNSDTEVFQDFLPMLSAALAEDPQLAVISPAHSDFVRYAVNRYLRRTGGYIPAYRFKGHAFLIRRCIFQEIGGFDPIFGRGYFEDIDLSRRIDQLGWRIGVHPDVYIHHEGGGSFGRGRAYRKLIQSNRTFYLSRYPDARRNVLLVSDCNRLADISVELWNAVTHVFRQGGNLDWITPIPAPQLLCLHMRNNPASLATVVKLMLRGLIREDRRVSEVWILPGVPRLLRALLTTLTRIRRIEMLTWEMQQDEFALPGRLSTNLVGLSATPSLKKLLCKTNE